MGRQFLDILFAALGMTIAITGICFKTGYFETDNPNKGVVLIFVGVVITIYYLRRLKN